MSICYIFVLMCYLMCVAHPSRVFLVLICLVWLLWPIYFSGGVSAATYRKVGVLFEIWNYVCQWACRSYVSCSYSFYKCDLLPVHLNVCPSFLSLWRPWYLLLFHFMSRIYYMVWISGITIVAFDVVNMSFIANIERYSCLTIVFQWAV